MLLLSFNKNAPKALNGVITSFFFFESKKQDLKWFYSLFAETFAKKHAAKNSNGLSLQDRK